MILWKDFKEENLPMLKILRNIIILLALGFIAFYYRAPIRATWTQVINYYIPCAEPITYKLEKFDERFGITEEEFLEALRVAEAIWEEPMGKELFHYSPEGVLKVNLIYDIRQEYTQNLREMGIAVENTKASYDAVRAKYDLLSLQYDREKAAFELRVQNFDKRRKAYEAEVVAVNRRGGANEATYERLSAEKTYLNSEAIRIQQEQVSLNKKVDDINSLASALNKLAVALNINVREFNTIGGSLDGEFEEGTYRSSAAGQQIDIYQFENQSKLIRVLAHELGHALGLDHVEDPLAIMYRLNNGVNESLTESDIVAVKALCQRN